MKPLSLLSFCFVGSNRWQSTDTFDDLRLPKDDPNLIVSAPFPKLIAVLTQ